MEFAKLNVGRDRTFTVTLSTSNFTISVAVLARRFGSWVSDAISGCLPAARVRLLQKASPAREIAAGEGRWERFGRLPLEKR